MGGTGAANALIGTMVGSYRIERLLGEGGMGAVYELLHPGIGKRLALKLLHAEYAARPQIVQRFFDEARAVNLIGHPNIVDIIDFAHLADGRAYITMEYLEGCSLAAHIHRRGPMPAGEVREIMVPICSALGAAHAVGIVHRDLKPENIHLVPRPDNPRYVKVLDFGIAKLSADLHQEPGAATRSGVVMGTPSYMSPEQAMGRTREIDHRTDVYALGVILYEMLTGVVPFAAESFGDLMLMHLQQPPPSLTGVRPDLSPAWSRVIDVAMAKRREDRFQSMEAMSQAIQQAAAGVAGSAQAPTLSLPADAPLYTPPSVAPYHPSQPPHTLTPLAGRTAAPAPEARRSRAPLFAVAGLVAAAAAVAVLYLARGKGDPDDKLAAAPPAPVATPDAGPAPAPPPSPPPAPPPVVVAAPPDAGVPDARVKAPGTPPAREEKGEGMLVVIAKPWAEVTIDGTPAGMTPVTRKLSAGRHKVRLRNGELGQDTTVTVKIKAGKTERLSRTWE